MYICTYHNNLYTLRLLLIATTNFSTQDFWQLLIIFSILSLNEAITIVIPYNAQHEAARYGCCVFVCESCTPAAVNEVLSMKYEVSNPYDHYAIVLKKQLPGCITRSVVSHMQPKVLSIIYSMVAEKVIKRSPLFQGGLEIPVEVSLSRIKIFAKCNLLVSNNAL